MLHTQVVATDSVVLTSRKVTSEGFLSAPAHLARIGVQNYRASEFPPLVAGGMDASATVRLYRSPEEVFSTDSMASFDGIPVIMEPHQTVTSSNWKKLAVGDVHTISRDGDLLGAARLVIRDSTAVGDVQSGKKHLSNGYKFDLDMTPGVTPDGQVYDGVQRNIVGNHVAVCTNPRGGAACSIADTEPKGERMININIDGIPVEVGDTAAAAINKVLKQRDDAIVASASSTEKLTKDLKAKDAEITDLKAKVLSPEQLDAEVSKRVTERVAIVGDALKLVPDYKPADKDNSTVQRDVITAVVARDAVAKALVGSLLGASTLSAAPAPLVATVFGAVVATATPVTKDVQAGDAAVARAFTGSDSSDHKETKLTGRAAFLARQNESWQPVTRK